MIEELEIINKLAQKFDDEESLRIFDARVMMYLKNDHNYLLDNLISEAKYYSCGLLNQYLKKLHSFTNVTNQKVYIYGASNTGRRNYKRIKMNELCTVIGYIDNKMKEDIVDGIPVLKLQDLIRNYDNELIIISINNPKTVANVFGDLLHNGIPREYIYWEPRTFSELYGMYGSQYFDFDKFMPAENEIFIDAGCLDMNSSMDFIKWTNGKYEKIYAFEPDDYNFKVCENIVREKNLNDVELLHAGTWSENATLRFNHNNILGGSKIDEKGEEIINVVSIDETLQGKPATFIKMDIEGAELQALIGAKKTIQTYKPKLAISIYHKPSDILELPKYILELVPEYKISLRHYSTIGEETILYAYI
ncbi:MAG: hypothetical protein K0S47_3648 [Herbinix sp.]|jgi:FkbM family methyltransferase|nr:hypothetical protein [Herbinix sp.]